MKQKILMFICAIPWVLYSINVFTQTTHINGPAGSGVFGGRITVLTNGNYVVVDSLYDEDAVLNVGAVYLYNGSTHSLISILKGSTAEDQVGGNGELRY
ncbi:MAG: hypothetical protein IPM85_06185 [Chitinophagaceae bacterium]|nr:hypothetical protein [Chitinophagaceae bacterium]